VAVHPRGLPGQTYFILLNTYNDFGPYNWSIQVRFDAGTNFAQSIAYSGSSDGNAVPLVRGQWVEIRDEIDFDNDTQSFYYNNQLVVTKSWTQGVSGGGALNLAAVDLFANGASPVYYDDISLTGGTGAMGINRTWTATDACLNASQCVQTITVDDTIAPVITARRP